MHDMQMITGKGAYEGPNGEKDEVYIRLQAIDALIPLRNSSTGELVGTTIVTRGGSTINMSEPMQDIISTLEHITEEKADHSEELPTV